MSILIKNSLIMKISDEISYFNGDILIENDTISEIGDIKKEKITDLTEIIDAKGMLAMPGLINTHNHSPMVLLRAFSDDLRLMEWLEKKMFPAEARMTDEDIYWGSLLGIAEMIKSGTTSFADMYIGMENIAEAVKDSGIRASLCRGLLFIDNDGDKRLREGIDLIENWTGKADGRITTMLGPHAPFTCSPENMKEVVKVALQLKVPMHIHLAETKEEVQMINDRYGKSPSRYLYDLEFFNGEHHVLLAHSVHLDETDIQLIKNNKGGVAHNPMSNLKLGCGISPVKSMIENGITVGLGTDGAGSASSLDLFKEMKLVCLQKAVHFDPTVITAEKVIKMATVEGTKLLGIQDQVGSLEVGKKADIILININQPHMVPHNNISSIIAYTANGSDVDTTIVNGKILMRNRRLTTINEEELLLKAQEISKRLTNDI